MIRTAATEFRIVHLSRIRPVLVLALVIGLLPLTSAAAVEPTTPDPEVVPDVSAAEDQPPVDPAWAEARETDERVELLSERTATSRAFANPDGATTLELYPGPAFVWQEGPPPAAVDEVDVASGELAAALAESNLVGEVAAEAIPPACVEATEDAPEGCWVAIDTTLETTADGSIAPAAAAVDLRLSAGGSSPLAVLGAGDTELSMRWPKSLPAPELDGPVARYPDVLPGADLEVEAVATGYKWRVVLRERPTKAMSFDIPLGKLRLAVEQTDEGQLLLIDQGGKTVAVSDPARMWGAEVDPRSDEPTRSAAVTTRLLSTSKGQVLRVTPDVGFLSDPTVTLPITIDPSPSLTATADTFVQSNISSSSQWSATELKAGTYDGGSTKARAFVRFDVSSLSGKLIQDADLKLWTHHSWSCTGSSVIARRLTSSFGSSTVWSAQPSYTTSGSGSATYAAGYSSSCPDAWGVIPVTNIVSAWASGTANYGFALFGSETSSSGWKKFNSIETGTKPPTLAVTYNSIPSVPSNLSPASGAKVADLTPALSATFSDPDGGTGMLVFEVARNSDGVVVASGSKTGVSSGSSASWSPPSNLSSQTVYKWRVRGSDLHATSAFTSWRTITPDTTAPAAPSTSSSTHPSTTTWYAADDVAVSWSGSDPTGIIGYSWIRNQTSTTTPDTTSEGTGTSTTLSNLADGTHWFHVRARDGAGNWGATHHRQIRIDDTPPPAPTVTSSTHSSTTTWYPSRSPAFSWTASDVSGVNGYRYVLNQTSTTTPSTATVVTGTSKSYSSIADGTHWFHVQARNGAGLWGATQHRQVRIDGTAPSGVTVSSSSHPDPDQWVDSRTITASWTAATDASSGVAGYAIAVNQSATTAPTGTLQTTRSTTKTVAGDGLWYLHVRPKDNAGNWGPTAHYRFGVDTGSASILQPEAGQTLQGLVTMQASSSPSATSATFEAYAGGDPDATASWTTIGTDNTPDSSFRWEVDWDTAAETGSVRDWPNGPYRIRVVFGYTGGSSRAVVGPLVTVDDARLGFNGAWSFHDLGAGAQVNIATGNVLVSDDDVSLATATGGIAVARTYNSRGTGLLGPLGWGWDFSLPTDAAPATWSELVVAARDAADAPASVGAEGPDGDTVWFLYDQTQPTTSWVAEASEIGLQLTRTGVGAWTLTDLDGTIHHFQVPADWTPPPGGDADAFDTVPVAEVIPPYGVAGGTTYGYDPDGRLKSVTDTDSGRRFDLTWTGSGSSARVDTATAAFDGNRVVADYDYDTSGRLIAATGRDGLTTRYAYHGSSDLLATITPPGRQPVRLAYDPAITGRLTAAERDHDSGTGIQTAHTELTIGSPDVDGSLTATVRTARGVAADDASSDWTYQFDGASRTTAVTAPGQPTRQSTWSATGQLLTSQTAAEAAAGDHTAYAYSDTVNCVDGQLSDGAELCTTTGPLQTWQAADGTMVTDRPVSTMFYDSDRLLVRAELPDGTAIVNGYNADGSAARQPNVVTTLAPDGAPVSERRQTYDSLGRVVTETMPKGVASGNLSAFTTTFAYGPHGQLASLSRPGTAGTTTAFDDWSQPTSQTGGSGTTTLTYDAATGRLTSITDPDGRTLTYGYATATGLPTTAADPTGTVTTDYDDWGRVITVTDASGESTSYGHDLESNIVTRTDRHGTVDYTVDRLGQVIAMADPSGTYGFGWAADGTLATAVLPNGITATATARPGVGDAESLTYSAADGTELGGFVRTYDPLGRLVAEVRPAGERRFDYDPLGRLISAEDLEGTGTLVQTRTYGYDANANRTAKTVTDGTGATVTTETLTVDDADRLTARMIDGVAGGYSYDPAGNTLTGDGRTYTWTGADRIQQVTGDVGGVSMVVDYTLDPLGRTLTRTETASGATVSTARSHYSDAGDSPAWTVTTNGGADTTVRHVAGPTGLLAQHTVGADVEWLLTSPHGETWAVTDAAGHLVRQADADEFGVPLVGAPSDAYDGWLGRQQRSVDTTFGLTLMGVRLYQPDLGRFLTVDPVYGGSASDYDYCNADPTNCYDLGGDVARPDPAYLRRLGRALDDSWCAKWRCWNQAKIEKAVFYFGMVEWYVWNYDYFMFNRNPDAAARYESRYKLYTRYYNSAVMGIAGDVAKMVVRFALNVHLRGIRL